MLRLALAQINPTVGDIDGNAEMVKLWAERATQQGADLVAFPELVITGYPPEDLVMKSSFVAANRKALEELAGEIGGIAAIVGFVDSDADGIYNAAAIVDSGSVVDVYRKHRLPNYGVFDEERTFESGSGLVLAHLDEALIGITICEDVWASDGPQGSYAAAGASLVININGSPYHKGKGEQRIRLLSSRARSAEVALAYVNMVGGQDELVFDGQSLIVDEQGELVARASQFSEELLVADLQLQPPQSRDSQPGGEGTSIVRLTPSENKAPVSWEVAGQLHETEEIYSALVLGVRDYVRKNRRGGALVGLSGGIDSSLTAAIAVDALGPKQVRGVFNPSRFTSKQSEDYATQLAQNLGIEMIDISIDGIFEKYLTALEVVFEGTEHSTAEENIQARIRGALWMAISNKSDATGERLIVLSTGNKSELAVGYATLYGDMAGGFAVLKDVPKTLVYELAKWRNRSEEVIPAGVIARAPTAELRESQLDTDSLPAYEELDPILEAYVEEDRNLDEIAALGYEREVVRAVMRLVDRAEYKRRQAPPGIKISEKAFGRDRRLPITNRFSE